MPTSALIINNSKVINISRLINYNNIYRRLLPHGQLCRNNIINNN